MVVVKVKAKRCVIGRVDSRQRLKRQYRSILPFRGAAERSEAEEHPSEIGPPTRLRRATSPTGGGPQAENFLCPASTVIRLVPASAVPRWRTDARNLYSLVAELGVSSTAI